MIGETAIFLAGIAIYFVVVKSALSLYLRVLRSLSSVSSRNLRFLAMQITFVAFTFLWGLFCIFFPVWSANKIGVVALLESNIDSKMQNILLIILGIVIFLCFSINAHFRKQGLDI